MIYYIECDSAKNVHHICGDPNITIVPLVSIADVGLPKDANGNSLSVYGLPLAEPVAITAEVFNELMAAANSNTLDDYTYDASTQTISKKVTNAPATT
jgi:hypothetical protein